MFCLLITDCFATCKVLSGSQSISSRIDSNDYFINIQNSDSVTIRECSFIAVSNKHCSISGICNLIFEKNCESITTFVQGAHMNVFTNTGDLVNRFNFASKPKNEHFMGYVKAEGVASVDMHNINLSSIADCEKTETGIKEIYKTNNGNIVVSTVIYIGNQFAQSGHFLLDGSVKIDSLNIVKNWNKTPNTPSLIEITKSGATVKNANVVENVNYDGIAFFDSDICTFTNCFYKKGNMYVGGFQNRMSLLLDYLNTTMLTFQLHCQCGITCFAGHTSLIQSHRFQHVPPSLHVLPWWIPKRDP